MFDRIPTGTFHYINVIILGLGNLSDAVEVLSIGYILTAYESQEGATISSYWKGFLAAAVFAGMLVGGIVCGLVSDVIGRRPCLLVCLALNSIAAFGSAFSPNLVVLILFRILAGLGVGGSVPSVFTMATEVMPLKLRGFFTVIVAWFWTLGAILTASIAWYVLGHLQSSWRVFAGICSVPALCTFLLCLSSWMPESPRYYFIKKKYRQAGNVLISIGTRSGMQYSEIQQHVHQFSIECEEDDKILSEMVPLQVSGAHDGDETVTTALNPSPSTHRGSHFESNGTSTKNQYFHSLSKLYNNATTMKKTIILQVCWFCLSFGSYGLSVWIPQLFEKVGYKKNSKYMTAFIFAGSAIPGNIVSAWLIESPRIGRRRLMAGSMVSASIAALIFAFHGHGWLLTVGAACLFSAFSNSGWNAQQQHHHLPKVLMVIMKPQMPHLNLLPLVLQHRRHAPDS